MQILVLALVIGVFLHDSVAGDAGRRVVEGWPLLGLFLAPKLLIGGIYFIFCRVTYARLRGAGAQHALRWLDRGTAVFRWSILVMYALDLWMGVLTTIRQALGGDLVLVDELAVMTPALAMVVWGWWSYYPIERRLREAALMGRLDSGLPIHPIWSRRQYIVAQLRHHVIFMLAPALVLMGLYEAIYRIPESTATWAQIDARPLLLLIGAACTFVGAPLMIRHLWDTAPLPAGELRDRLTAMCRQHHVGVRDLLLWRTFGGMVNGAVMGVVGPFRYILLTDALLEMMSQRHVEAVMAHELAHVRRHHMFWLLVIAASALAALQAGWIWALDGVAHLNATAGGLIPLPAALTGGDGGAGASEGVTMVLAMVSWVFVFGWVSRRFERQADTFAVQHLSRQRALSEIGGESAGAATNAAGAAPLRIDAESAAAMTDALQQVADLNNIAPRRRSWRHGSIAWRQAHLRSLIGRPVDDLPIDQQVHWIKFAGATVMIAMLTIELRAHGLF